VWSMQKKKKTGSDLRIYDISGIFNVDARARSLCNRPKLYARSHSNFTFDGRSTNVA